MRIIRINRIINSEQDALILNSGIKKLKPQQDATSIATFNPHYYLGSSTSVTYVTSKTAIQMSFTKDSSNTGGRLALSLVTASRVSWFSKCIQRLESLRSLQKNWDSYDTEPPNSTALYWSQVVLETLLSINFPPSHISASAEEGVNISFICDDKYADIECLNTGEILAVNSNRRDYPDVWQVNPSREDIKRSLEKIRAYLQS